jgi:hypothetical protein
MHDLRRWRILADNSRVVAAMAVRARRGALPLPPGRMRGSPTTPCFEAQERPGALMEQ